MPLKSCALERVQTKFLLLLDYAGGNVRLQQRAVSTASHDEMHAGMTLVVVPEL
jgi:hypothetical protein